MLNDEILDHLSISQNWSIEWEKRVFWYEAFLSHRRFDHSHTIQKALQERFGLRVFHDGDANVRDLEVIKALTNALNNARYVVVCVSDDHLSDFCRAEYLPALRIEERTRSRKVLVVQMTENAHVPEELASHPRFVLPKDLEESDSALTSLASFLRSGNDLPFDLDGLLQVGPVIGEETRAAVIRRAEEILKRRTADTDTSSPENIELRLALVIAESRTSAGALIDLMYLRNHICSQNIDWHSFAEETLHFIRGSALHFGESRNTDNRANAIMILCRLGDLNRLPEIRADILRLLVQECTGGLNRPLDGHIARTAACWLSAQPSLTDDERSSLELTVISVPREMKHGLEPSRIDSMPEAIRARSFTIAGLCTEALSITERLVLVERRVDYIIECDAKRDEKDRGFQVELELELRELKDLLFKYGEAIEYGAEEKVVYAKVIGIFDSIATASKHTGLPLLYVGERIPNFVISPLLLCTVKNH